MTSALASLTATYTDSEGEDENDEVNEDAETTSKSPNNSTPDNKSTPSSQPASPAPVRVTTRVTKLVSYHDDTVASDEDGENEDVPHQVILMIENDQGETEMSKDDGITIPPEPPGHCSQELQEKITQYYEKMQTQQLDMNAVIQTKKGFRNPSIYEKLIQFCDLDELGTNYPPSIYDPLKWNKESYYEELAKIQKSEMDKLEKERKSKFEFISGTKKHDDDKKRKSKWDQPGGSVAGSVKPAGLVQPSLTSASGTKGPAIPAFGSLPKKPKP